MRFGCCDFSLCWPFRALGGMIGVYFQFVNQYTAQAVFRTTQVGGGSVLPYFLLFCFFSAGAALLQHLDQSTVEVNGVYIPDVVALSNTVDAYATNRLDESQVQAITGVTTLYLLPWKLWPPLVLALNLALVFLTLKIYAAIFSGSAVAHHAAGIGVVLSSPYHYLAATGANKEIPVMLLTALFLYLIIKRPNGWLALSLVVAAVAYFFRDGYAYIFVLAAFMSAWIPEQRSKFMWMSAAMFTVCAAAFWVIQNKFSVLARNKEVQEYVQDISASAGGSRGGGVVLMSGGNLVSDVLSYFTRVIYNITTLGAFPQFQTETGNVFVLGISYWVFGIVMIGSVAACIWTYYAGRSQLARLVNVRISAIVLFFMLALGVSTYLQPRYAMPIIPAALGVCVLMKKRGAIAMGVSVAICLLIIAIYWVRGYPPSLGQPSEGISVFSPRL